MADPKRSGARLDFRTAGEPRKIFLDGLAVSRNTAVFMPLEEYVELATHLR